MLQKLHWSLTFGLDVFIYPKYVVIIITIVW